MVEKKLFSVRDGFGRGLVEAAQKDGRLVVVSADLKTSLRLGEFEKQFPDRFFEVGVAEQNMVGVGAGLALTGLRSFACTFACFSPALTFAQIKQSVIENEAGVVLVGSHGGVVTGPDGVSHQALEDVGLMRNFPELTIVVPADDQQAYQATIQLAQAKGAAYLRLARPKTPRLGGPVFKLGQARVLRSGSEMTLISCGPVLNEVMAAADDLMQKKIEAEVIDCATIQPLDKKTILKSVQKTGRFLVIEDHQPATGLGSAVTLLLAQEGVRGDCLGVTKSAGSGFGWQELLAKNGLGRQNIVKQTISLLEAKK